MAEIDAARQALADVDAALTRVVALRAIGSFSDEDSAKLEEARAELRSAVGRAAFGPDGLLGRLAQRPQVEVGPADDGGGPSVPPQPKGS